MVSVRITGVSKNFGQVTALDEVSFEVGSGQFITLLGPSGCGKTTLLRCLAGLETPDRGEIVIGDSIAFSAKERILVPPNNRNVGMVFQSYALWPHMKVRDNIAFGLVERKWDKARIRAKVDEVASLLNLKGLEERYPSELSGGQQQRVALGRAIAYSSDLLLLDEPLSNLDAKLRERMRFEIKEIQKRIGVTMVYVTHDRREALSMSDEIVVMSGGKIIDKGNATSLWGSPSVAFVADFLGLVKLFDGVVSKKSPQEMEVSAGGGLVAKCRGSEKLEIGTRVQVFADSYDINLSVDPSQARDRNFWGAEVKGMNFMGREIDYEIQLGGNIIFVRSIVRVPIGTVHVHVEKDALIAVVE